MKTLQKLSIVGLFFITLLTERTEGATVRILANTVRKVRVRSSIGAMIDRRTDECRWPSYGFSQSQVSAACTDYLLGFHAYSTANEAGYINQSFISGGGTASINLIGPLVRPPPLLQISYGASSISEFEVMFEVVDGPTTAGIIWGQEILDRNPGREVYYRTGYYLLRRYQGIILTAGMNQPGRSEDIIESAELVDGLYTLHVYAMIESPPLSGVVHGVYDISAHSVAALFFAGDDEVILEDILRPEYMPRLEIDDEPVEYAPID